MTSDTAPELRARTAVIIEDDDDLRHLLAVTLRMNGFQILEAADGQTGIDLVREHAPDLVTVDLNLPDLDGVEVCRQIRPRTDAYIVIITARLDEIDHLIGLEIGADDFMTKPFSPRALGARVNALFRRPRTFAAAPPVAEPEAVVTTQEPAPAPSSGDFINHGPLAVDVDGRVALLDGRELPLTRIEFDLLAILVSGPRRVWTRETLLSRIWGEGWINDQHLVEVHVRNLRKKLGEDAQAPRFIRTVRGVGYRMVPAAN